MHKPNIIKAIALVSSSLSIVFSVLLALSALAGHVGAGLGTKTLAVALALVFECSKFGFAAEAVHLLRGTTKMVRMVGITCAVVSASLFGLSTAASIAYVQHVGGELHAQETQAMQKQLTIAATQSQAAQAARAQLAGIDREREILRKQIASTQDSIDRDLAEGYRTRAVQSMAHMEHLKNELRTLDDKEEQARKEEGQAHAVVAATQEPAPVPSDAMAGVLGVMLEIVSLLSVVVASMQQQQPNARDDAKQNAAPFIQAQGETPTVHRVADVPAEVLAMPNPTYRTIAKTLGCTQNRARDLARKVKELRAQSFALHA